MGNASIVLLYAEEAMELAHISNVYCPSFTMRCYGKVTSLARATIAPYFGFLGRVSVYDGSGAS